MTGKISEMPNASALDGTESVPLVQSGANVRTTTAVIAALAPPPDAGVVEYDNATSGLAATDVQAAIDELAASSGGGSGAGTQSIIVACSDETTAIAAGSAKITFRMPYAFTLSGVRASLTNPQTSGSTFTVDINEGGTSVLSTKITIDNGEKTSTTAATAPLISDIDLADDAEITIDVDQVGDGTATGLKVALIGTPA